MQHIPSEMQADTSKLPTNGQLKTVTLSSNLTLFWRIFVPIFSTIFLTGLVLAFLLMDANDFYISILPMSAFRVLLVAIWIFWIYFMRRTLWRLKRVDADSLFFYVTDYWTTVRYPWHDLEQMDETHRMGRRIVHFCLKAPGRFGQKISFLPGSYFNIWKSENILS